MSSFFFGSRLIESSEPSIKTSFEYIFTSRFVNHLREVEKETLCDEMFINKNIFEYRPMRVF